MASAQSADGNAERKMKQYGFRPLVPQRLQESVRWLLNLEPCCKEIWLYDYPSPNKLWDL